MYQLKIGTLPLPKLYVCEGRAEANKARELGIPYIIKPRSWDDDKLVKAVLYKTLINLFPAIKWKEVFGFSPSAANAVKVHVAAEHRDNPGFDTCGWSSPDMEVTDDGDYRSTGGGLDPDDKFEDVYTTTSIDDYIGDLGYAVNIEELQALKILPVFMDDIAKAIKTNLHNTAWCDGYNKKLGVPLGYWQGSQEAPNLIILDVSGSIPSGVASTMVSLIDTLRHQANADLIITSGRSVYYKAGDELPDPDRLSYLIGGCNECRQFYDILRKNIFGKHWGNVIVFGDQDAPEDRRFMKHKDCWIKGSEMSSTRIDRIMAFHTYERKIPGYGLWAEKAAPNAEIIYNTAWVNDMDTKRYY